MGWPVVEDGLRLDVHRAVTAGKGHRTPIRWQWTCDGEVTGWINMTVTLEGEAFGVLALTYTFNSTAFDQRFRFEASPCGSGRQIGQAASDLPVVSELPVALGQ
jgi:hypothetical protein